MSKSAPWSRTRAFKSSLETLRSGWLAKSPGIGALDPNQIPRTANANQQTLGISAKSKSASKSVGLPSILHLTFL